MPSIHELLRKTYEMPGGRWLISRLVGRTAPYSGTIGAEILELGDGYARLAMRDRRRVRNHLDSIHACALATLTETTVGISVLYSLPPTLRGIATRLSVEYHAKARGTITSECRWELPPPGQDIDQDIRVEMKDESGAMVATGSVHFRIGPARSG